MSQVRVTVPPSRYPVTIRIVVEAASLDEPCPPDLPPLSVDVEELEL